MEQTKLTKETEMAEDNGAGVQGRKPHEFTPVEHIRDMKGYDHFSQTEKRKIIILIQRLQWLHGKKSRGEASCFERNEIRALTIALKVMRFAVDWNTAKPTEHKCSCEESTGWTTVKCCNICGLPIPEEVWFFRDPTLGNHQPATNNCERSER